MEGQDVGTTAAGITQRRTPNACVRCKSRKIRCDGKVPSCDRCLNCKATCRYEERKGRGPGKNKQYIQSLEQRLKEVETTRQTSPARDEDENQNLVEPNDSDDTQFTDGTTTADRIHAITSRYPKEITTRIIHAQHHMSYFERAIFVRLPPKAHINPFITSALEDVNQVWPLFSPREVLKLVDEQYAAGPSNCDDNPTRWATLNALIAMGVHWKADNKATGELFPISWAYFKNAYGIFPELVMQGADVQACQAILAMALFMQGTADARTFTNLLSAAAQVGQCIGLHLKDVCSASELVEVEKRRRTFWLIYVLQSNASIRFELQAPTSPTGSLFHLINLDDEVDVDLPNQDPTTYACNTPSASVRTNLLRHMSTLALIQSTIHRLLYIGSALWKSRDGILQALTQLDNELEAWKLGLPAEFRPTSTPRAVEPGIMQLHFGYYASTWKIHAANNRLQELLAPTSMSSWEPRSLLLTSPTPADGARATIWLLQSLPPQPFVFLWQLICYPVCAVLILLAAVLDDPAGSEADSNLEWIGQFVRFLQDFQSREGCDLKNLIDGCSKLYDIASSAKDNPEDQGSWEENSAAELWQQYREVHVRLRGSADPMQVAQGLLTNMPLLCAKATEVFFGIFRVPCKDGFGPLVPEALKPTTFNFVFGPKQ
ncbi:hypothetical protein B0J13DRAFT_524892 [Dactylonectria estremocensis]|uniref:Zn(2)-C6 fungal-type domain-containing protein n=1 Tax=Dactylonectria estremocensis TaxID=1079267 RepID=A0A9P9EXD9_9HYPO|nr:hypothetical protein B0J13DRAFT_524892 [Dactylonectria estremocensis]